jgi:hypothetical protein
MTSKPFEIREVFQLTTNWKSGHKTEGWPHFQFKRTLAAVKAFLLRVMRKFDKNLGALATIIEEGKIHKLRLPKTDDTRKKLGDIGHSQYVEHDDHIGIYSKSPKAIRRVAEMLGGGARRAEQAAKKRTPLGKSIKPAMKKRLAAQEKKAAAKPGCGWFALCKNQSTTTRSHPILGDVPICKRCDDKVKAIEASSVEIAAAKKKRKAPPGIGINRNMNEADSLKEDNKFVLTEEDLGWMIGGNESGYIYGIHDAKSAALKDVKALSKKHGKPWQEGFDKEKIPRKYANMSPRKRRKMMAEDEAKKAAKKKAKK